MRTLNFVSEAGNKTFGDIQYCHEDGEPQLLGTEEGVRVAAPFSALDVVGVAQDDEDPGHLEALVIVLAEFE